MIIGVIYLFFFIEEISLENTLIFRNIYFYSKKFDVLYHFIKTSLHFVLDVFTEKEHIYFYV